jgi:hypothetical protein
MTQTQWDKHKEHLDEHISWPATKAQIVAACEGVDVEPSVLSEMKTKLQDGKQYTQNDVKKMLVAA